MNIDFTAQWGTHISTDGSGIASPNTPVPTKLQGLAALKQGWTPGALLQVQSCLNEQGGASSFMLRNIQYQVVA